MLGGGGWGCGGGDQVRAGTWKGYLHHRLSQRVVGTAHLHSAFNAFVPFLFISLLYLDHPESTLACLVKGEVKLSPQPPRGSRLESVAQAHEDPTWTQGACYVTRAVSVTPGTGQGNSQHFDFIICKSESIRKLSRRLAKYIHVVLLSFYLFFKCSPFSHMGKAKGGWIEGGRRGRVGGWGGNGDNRA